MQKKPATFHMRSVNNSNFVWKLTKTGVYFGAWSLDVLDHFWSWFTLRNDEKNGNISLFNVLFVYNRFHLTLHQNLDFF